MIQYQLIKVHKSRKFWYTNTYLFAGTDGLARDAIACSGKDLDKVT